MLVLPCSGRHVSWLVETRNHVCKLHSQSATEPSVAEFEPKVGKKHKVLFEVRKDTVKVYLDNHEKPLNELKFEDTRLPHADRDRRQFGVGCMNSCANFYGLFVPESSIQENAPKNPKNDLPHLQH